MKKEDILKLENTLFAKKINNWESINSTKEKEIDKFAKEYIKVLNENRTEKEWSSYAEKVLLKNGYKDIEEVKKLKKGDKVFLNNKGKGIFALAIGENIFEGINIIGSHIDSPRLDLKVLPLIEMGDMAYFKTQYYGGIKKYQWTTIPLLLKGKISLINGKTLDISIGEKEDDPIFTISDLLPHLARKQMNKKASEVVEGEELNILIGGRPLSGSNKNSVKLNILKILNDKYGITESDFGSSEFEFVPAFPAKEAGLDKAFVAGYGQDDKVCSYANIRALIDSNSKSKRSKMLIFSDKEEIGSFGNTGAYTEIFEYFINEVLNKLGVNIIGGINKVFKNSKMLSADVDAGIDPIYSYAFDEQNSAKMSGGVTITKYTGSGGKYEASDANTELIRDIRKIWEKNKIKYQFTAMGKVDEGGGGTIAYILANRGIEVVDSGIGILSMHSPYELASKFDIYEMYKAYKIFFDEMK